MLRFVGSEQFIPLRFVSGPVPGTIPSLVELLAYEEGFLIFPIEGLSGECDLVRSKRSTVTRLLTLLVGGSEADFRTAADE